MQPPERHLLIGQALDRLVALGRASEFQRLAFHVLKRRYPDLVLSELSHDGGEDAFALPAVGASPNTPSLACSFTATLAKVKKDCRRIRERGVHPPGVVFVTPKAVRQTTVDEWNAAIEEEFGHGLEVLGRSALVGELEQPEMGWVCREYLGIDEPANAAVAVIGAQARAATELRLKSWEAEAGAAAGDVVLNVRPMDQAGQGSTTSLSAVDALSAAVRGARRLVLIGPPGGGKTVTITQVTRALYAGSGEIAPLLMSAAEWSTSGSQLIDFVAAELNLTLDDLRPLDEAGRLVVLINGWNEIAERDRTRAAHALSVLGRRLPSTGILLTTRLVGDRPSLPRAEAFQLERLSRDARRVLIRTAGVADPERLIRDLEQDEVLDAMTRTPLFLTVALAIVRGGQPLPRSPWALLEAFVQSVEQGEHAPALVEALRGQHRRYLADLAAQLTSSGGTSLRADEARRVIGATSTRLVREGLIGQPPDAEAVLLALTAHHLVVPPSGPSGTVRFQHQQFQAWAATEWLASEVARTRSDRSDAAMATLQREVLDRPAWTDAIVLLVDRLGQEEGADAAATLRDLLYWLLPLDLLFAASCVPIVGAAAWDAIGKPLTAALRALRARPSPEEQEYALAGMLATGTAVFSDVIWPLLESDDTQVRLASLRAWVPFSVKSLGPEWAARWSGWSPDRRAEFVQELIMNGPADERHEVVALVAADPSSDVRMAAVGVLDFVGDLDAAVGLLGTDPTLWAKPEAIEVLRSLSEESMRGLQPTLQSAAAMATPGRARWAILRALTDAGAPNSVEAIRAACVDAPLDHLTEDVLPYLETVDPEWTTNWILDRIAAGAEMPDAITALVGPPDAARVRALVQLALGDRADSRVMDRRLTALSRIASLETTQGILGALRADAHAGYVAGDEVARAFCHDCNDLLRAAPVTVRAAAVLALSDFPRDELEVSLFRGLFGPRNPMEPRELDGLTGEQQAALRGLVLTARDVMGPTATYVRDFHYSLATLLGSFGDPSDIEVLLAWAREDAAERRRLVAARASGAAMSYANWYVGAFVRIGSPAAVAALEQLLQEPEYLGEASLALVAMVGTDEGRAARHGPWRPDYQQARARRAVLAAGPATMPVEHPEVVRARTVIRDAVGGHLARLDAGESTPAPYALGEAARALGQLGDASAVPLLLSLARRPGCEWGVIDGLHALAVRGVALPGAETAAVVEPLIERTASGPAMSSADPWWFGLRCLAVLLLSDTPELGVERARRLLPVLVRSQHMRELAGLLGACQAPPAEALLVDLLRGTDPRVWWYHELVAAVGAYRTATATAALLEVLDAALSPATNAAAGRAWDVLVQEFGHLGREDPNVLSLLHARVRGALDPAGRDLLAAILRAIGGDAAALVACDLLLDAGPRPIPFGVSELVRDATRRHEPSEHGGGWYVRVPRAAPELRARLFELLTSDPARRESARRLLLSIETDRIETRHPSDERRHPNGVDAVRVVSVWSLV